MGTEKAVDVNLQPRMRGGQTAHDFHGGVHAPLDRENAQGADVGLGRSDGGVLHPVLSAAAPNRSSIPGCRSSSAPTPASVEEPWDFRASAAQAAASPG